jgi:transcriptional regulator with XRE-family HTH domain
VTTDTISRWENRRYPSIKKDNGIKLAEALNVSIEDILEDPSLEEPGTRVDLAPQKTTNKQKSYGFKKTWPLLLLGLTLLAITGAFLILGLPSSQQVSFKTERIVPKHCTPGQPFPVIIKVTGSADSSTALIIREILPEKSSIHKVSPVISSSDIKNHTIKWLKKINASAVFAYIISIDEQEGNTIHFAGTAAIGRDTIDPVPIGGDTTSTLSKYHWADTDKNNTISDSEILAVYDQYSEIDGIDTFIDTIEEIWLGSGYKWNSEQSSFEIIE